jgi:hypothetical protein
MAAAGSAPWDAAAAVEACPTTEWSGDVWRCHGRKYAGDSAAGSLKATGRFNRGSDRFAPHETWPALYTGLALHVALGERLRHTTPESLAQLGNQRISRLRVKLQAVVMACGLTGCSDIGVPGMALDDLCNPVDYTKTHEFARAARTTPVPAEALLIPTCTRFSEGNLIIFPDLLRWSSEVRLVESQDPDLFVDWDHV